MNELLMRRRYAGKKAGGMDYSKEYFTIESLADNNVISILASAAGIEKTVSCSTDKATWTSVTSSTEGATLATLNNGDKLYIKGSNTAYGTSSAYNTINASGDFDVSGNIMSLLYGDSFQGKTEFPTGSTYTFNSLFKSNTKIKSAGNLMLPANTMVEYCYANLFDRSSLVTPPELPSTTLAKSCYEGLFDRCSSLETAPFLPAKTLYARSYIQLFFRCSKISSITCLATNISANSCVTNWVSGVASSGTFVKAASMTGWSSGGGGIPSGWTVEDYTE